MHVGGYAVRYACSEREKRWKVFVRLHRETYGNLRAHMFGPGHPHQPPVPGSTGARIPPTYLATPRTRPPANDRDRQGRKPQTAVCRLSAHHLPCPAHVPPTWARRLKTAGPGLIVDSCLLQLFAKLLTSRLQPLANDF